MQRPVHERLADHVAIVSRALGTIWAFIFGCMVVQFLLAMSHGISVAWRMLSCLGAGFVWGMAVAGCGSYVQERRVAAAVGILTLGVMLLLASLPICWWLWMYAPMSGALDVLPIGCVLMAAAIASVLLSAWLTIASSLLLRRWPKLWGKGFEVDPAGADKKANSHAGTR